MVQLVSGFLTGLLIALPVGSLVAWVYFLSRKAHGHPILRFDSRRAVPWGVIHPFLVFLLVVFLSSAALIIVCRIYGISSFTRFDRLSPEPKAAVLGATALASLAALVLSIFILGWSAGADREDFGFDPGSWMRDVLVGSVAFVMIVVPVFATQHVLTLWQESRHPIVQLLRSRPEPLFFVVSAFAAVVVAPVAEEFFFRVFLQGALENLACTGLPRGTDPAVRNRQIVIWLLGRHLGASVSPDETMPPASAKNEREGNPTTALTIDDAGVCPPTTDATADDVNPYRPPTRAEDRPIDWCAADSLAAPSPLTRPSAWPILVSSALFAMAHYGHGPDPIPLFLLALGLGYVYQRTHRVLPCIVIHFLVNSISMLQLYLLVFDQSRT